MRNGMKKRLFAIICVFLIAALAAGCGGGAGGGDAPASGPAFSGQYIVNARYVVDALGSGDMILVDARGGDEAKKGTVEGAIAVAWQMFSQVANGAPGDDMWGTLLPADELGAALGAAGLDPAKEIIIFSIAQDGWGEDGRIAWGLLAAGYPDVKMVDGGYEALKAAGAPIARGAADYAPCAVSVSSLDASRIINTAELVANYEAYKVVDVRADREYQGAALYGEAAGGHLPGAAHVSYTDLFNADSTLKSNADISALFEAAGVNKDDAVVTYCTAGIRSAYAQLVLEMCGYADAKNYDESFYRWSATRPVEK